MNQMVNQIMGQQMQTNPLIQAWNMAQSAANPQQTLMDALSHGKNSNEVLEVVRKNNGDFEKAFYEYARIKGEDGNQLVQQLRSMGLK